MKRSIEGGVYICPAHVVLKHELPSGVFGEVKPAPQQQQRQQKKSCIGRNRRDSSSITDRRLPSEGLERAAGSRRNAAFRCWRLCRPNARRQNFHCEVQATERHLKERKTERKRGCCCWATLLHTHTAQMSSRRHRGRTGTFWMWDRNSSIVLVEMLMSLNIPSSLAVN